MESEKQVEQYMRREVLKHGGLFYKFVSPGNPGVPDRIVITPTGEVIFVELKTEAGRLSPVQVFQHTQLRERGVPVWTLYGTDDAKHFLRQVFDP